MTGGHEAVPLAAGHVIENPLSGEQIIIRTGATETGASCCVGARPRPRRSGAQQPRASGAGGTLHHPGRSDAVPGRRADDDRRGRSYRGRAAGDGAQLRERRSRSGSRAGGDPSGARHAGAAGDGRRHGAGAAGGRPPFPRVLDLMLFMRDFEREVRAPYLPRALVRLVTHTLSGLARLRGLDARYRRLRVPRGRPGRRLTPGGRSRCATWSSGTATPGATPWTGCRSTCPRGSCSACSARTARARPRSCRS